MAMRRRTPRRQPVRKSTQELLKEGYRRRAAEARALAAEWFPIEEEAWEVGQGRRRNRRPPSAS